jgi:diguanylate cyclase (GGDEF)-like protein
MDELINIPVVGDNPEREPGAEQTDLRLRLANSEDTIRQLRLEKLDFVRALRHMMSAMGTILSRGWAPGDIDSLVADILVKMDQNEVITPPLVDQFADKLVGHLEVKGAQGRKLSPSGAASFKEAGFLKFLDEVSSVKGGRYVEDVETLGNLIAVDAAVKVFMPLLSSFLLRIIGDTRLERQEISVKLSGIIRSLLNVEKQFKEFLDKSMSFIGDDNRKFSDTLTSHLDQIQGAVNNFSHEDHERLFSIISEEVDLISSTIKEKNQEDDKLLSVLSSERLNLKDNLADVTRDYSNFVKHSTHLLKELEVIKAVALRDALTGIYNRRAYDEQLFLTLINYKAGKLSTFCLVIFDIDYFRNVNNLHGHQAGDAILSGMAKVLVNTLRSDDFIFRYGGDEFVVLLPNANLEAGVKVAEKIRMAVEEHDFPLSKNGSETLSITISLGVTEVIPNDSSETILARADAALYASKAGGRNRVSAEDRTNSPSMP